MYCGAFRARLRPGFSPFLLPRIAREDVGRPLELRLGLGVAFNEGAGDAHLDGASPAGDATALALDLCAEAAFAPEAHERSEDLLAMEVAGEDLFHGLAVDDDGAVARVEADARDGGLAAAGAVVVLLVSHGLLLCLFFGGGAGRDLPRRRGTTLGMYSPFAAASSRRARARSAPVTWAMWGWSGPR